MTDVKQTITGDSTSAQKAYADLARQVAKLEQANQNLANKTETWQKNNGSAQGRMNTMVREGATQVAGMAAQWASVGMLVGAAKAQVEEYKRVLADAADTQVSVGEAQAKVIKNLASSSTGEKRAFLQDIEKLQLETSFQSLPQMLLASASGASASAGDIELTKSALAASIPLAKDAPEDLKELVGAAIDISKASGIRDAKKNLNFLLQVGTESRVVNLRDQATNVAPAVSLAAKTVTSDQEQATREAGALFSALTQEGVDPKGEVSRQAMTVIPSQLREFFTKGVKQQLPGRSRPITFKPAEDPNTIEGRIRWLQEHPRDAKAFMETANFGRERFVIPFEQLLSKGATDQRFQQALKNLNFGTGAYDQMKGELQDLTPQIQLSNLRKEGESKTKQFENASTTEALRAEATKIRDEAVVKTRKYAYGRLGLGYLSETAVLGLADQFLGDEASVKHSKEQLEQRQEQIRYSQRSIAGTQVYGDPRRSREQLNAQEQKDFDYLGKQIETLNSLMEQQVRITEEMNSRDKDKRPTAAGPARMEAGKGRER